MIVLVLASLVGGAFGRGAQVVNSAPHGYDHFGVARVDAESPEVAETTPLLLSGTQEGSASLPVEARRSFTTPAAQSNATNAAPRVTESMIREAMENAPLQTQQGAVSLPKVQSAVDKLAAGSSAPAIKVDGSIIVDGNHRYIAGQIMGETPPIQPWPGGNPGRVIPWWKQLIDPTDWGG